MVRTSSVFGEKILDRFPLTQDGWSRAWAALVKLDAGAAQAVSKVLQERQRQEAEERRRRLQSVRHLLDPECSDLLRRAEAAEESILWFYARDENLLDAPVDVELLRDNVEEVLNAGVKISNLRAQLRSMTSRVENLEHYASSVKTVDRTYRDWIGAQEAERLNDPVRDVLAETLRDELAVEELRRLTDRANIAKEAFRRSIYEANLAGETLALPDG